MLRDGNRGDDVARLQTSLSKQGFDLEVDGVFGPATESAVRNFQRQAGLSQDGIAGPSTLAALSRRRSPRYERDNVTAFLDMISHAEGTERFGGEQGYNVIVGGELFDSYADHPNKRVYLPAYDIYSTAAGRYQILHRFWVHYRDMLGLPDFSPESQDRYAIHMLRERGAWGDVKAGRIRDAITKVSNIWASLPGAGYGQREVAMDRLVDFYRQQGGRLA